MAKSLTVEEVIQRANNKHNYKYDYSKVKYIDAKTKIEIVCPEHGGFWQSPSKHYGRGQGCPVCAGVRIKMTDENFIERARKVHRDVYDYSKVINATSRNKVKIICSVHGEFEQRCDQHLAGKGCTKCGNNTHTTVSFIESANILHANKFDYAEVEYTLSTTPVTIICPEHGRFSQSPTNHLNGTGCPKCGVVSSAKSKECSQEEFIQKAKKVHGDKYTYDKTTYTAARDKITITCPEHGDFEQLASGHLSGYGCKHCVSYGGGKGDIHKKCMVYYFNVIGTDLYKIGLTSQSIEQRYRTQFDRDQIRLIYTTEYDNGASAYKVEQHILKKYTRHKYKGDKVMSTGNTELFTRDILGLDGLTDTEKAERWEAELGNENKKKAGK